MLIAWALVGVGARCELCTDVSTGRRVVDGTRRFSVTKRRQMLSMLSKAYSSISANLFDCKGRFPVLSDLWMILEGGWGMFPRLNLQEG